MVWYYVYDQFVLAFSRLLLMGYRYRKLCVIFRGSMMLLDILFSHYSVICVRNEGG